MRMLKYLIAPLLFASIAFAGPINPPSLEEVLKVGSTSLNSDSIDFVIDDLETGTPFSGINFDITRATASSEGFNGAFIFAHYTAATLGGPLYGLSVIAEAYSIGNGVTSVYGTQSIASAPGTGNITGGMTGVDGQVDLGAAGSVVAATAINADIHGGASTTVTTAIGLNTSMSGSMSATTTYQIKANDPGASTSSTNNYGVYIDEMTRGTNDYSLFINAAGKAHWRNSATSIHSSTAGQLDLTAATTVKINTAQFKTANYSFQLLDGTAGQFLKTDGAGAVTFSTGSVTAGGSTTQVQRNNGGVLDGIGTITSDDTNMQVTAGQIRFGDNDEAVFGTGLDSSVTYDGTNMVLDPNLVGSGAVLIGPTANDDLRADDLGLCGTAISATAVATGTCVGSKRGVLNFDYEKSGGTGVFANLLSTFEYTNATAAASGSGISSSVIESANNTGTSIYAVIKSAWSSTVNLTTGTHRYRGVEIVPGTGPASSSGATIFQVGLHQWAISPFASATAETIIGAIFEDDVIITTDDKLYFEGVGANTLTFGDTFISYPSDDLEITVDGVKGLDADSDQWDFALPAVFASTVRSSRTSDLGWVIVDGTDNTACTSQCTSAAVMGFNITAGNITALPLGPSDTTADICLCAGAS